VFGCVWLREVSPYTVLNYRAFFTEENKEFKKSTVSVFYENEKKYKKRLKNAKNRRYFTEKKGKL